MDLLDQLVADDVVDHDAFLPGVPAAGLEGHPFQTYVTTHAPTQRVVIGRIIASLPGAAPVTHSPVTPGVATKLRFRLEQDPRVWRTGANPILTAVYD
jgi:hypothetical protein